MKYKSIIKELK